MSTLGDVSGVANRLEKMLIAAGSGAATTTMKSNAKDTEGDTEKNSKCCAACGKGGDSLKQCTACKSVWYCNVSCQKAHRKAHVKMCKRIEKILKEEQQPAVGSKLSKDEDSKEDEKGNDTRNTNASEKGDNPKHIIQSRPDCDICMLPLPPPKIGSSYMPCCGKTLCSGCIFVHNRINEDEDHWPKCPFCRAPECATEEEYLALVKKRAALDDVEAIKKLAHYHYEGTRGVPVDAAKATELFRLTAERGMAHSYFMLGGIYGNGELGLDRDMAKAVEYYEMGANLGDPFCHCELGMVKGRRGSHVNAIKHFEIAAEVGLGVAVDMLIKYHQMGVFGKADLEKSIRAKYEVWAEMQSEERYRFIDFLKETGQYNKDDW